MPFPFFAIGPTVAVVGRVRDWQQSRRKVRLTVHRAFSVVGFTPANQPITGDENFYVTVTNASRDRDIEVTHAWLATQPDVHIHDPALPVRLKHSARFEFVVPITDVPPEKHDLVPWLACIQLSPDDAVVKSRPRKNVPEFGTVPRG